MIYCNCPPFYFSAFTHIFINLRTAQKMKLSFKGFFIKCDQIRRNLRIWSHPLKKSLMENFNFCAVSYTHMIAFAEKCMGTELWTFIEN